jgi:hypothetical protein
MSEPPSPEDPIWSRWRARHGRSSAPTDPPTEETANGAPGAEETAQGEERIRFGEPLGPDWAASRDPGAGPGGADPGAGPRADPTAGERDAHGERECLEWCPICRTADVVRASVPPELRSQLESVQRDALVAMRAMLDHYIERLDGQERPASRVEDIPIK